MKRKFEEKLAFDHNRFLSSLPADCPQGLAQVGDTLSLLSFFLWYHSHNTPHTLLSLASLTHTTHTTHIQIVVDCCKFAPNERPTMKGMFVWVWYVFACMCACALRSVSILCLWAVTYMELCAWGWLPWWCVLVCVYVCGRVCMCCTRLLVFSHIQHLHRCCFPTAPAAETTGGRVNVTWTPNRHYLPFLCTSSSSLFLLHLYSTSLFFFSSSSFEVHKFQENGTAHQLNTIRSCTSYPRHIHVISRHTPSNFAPVRAKPTHTPPTTSCHHTQAQIVDMFYKEAASPSYLVPLSNNINVIVFTLEEV